MALAANECVGTLALHRTKDKETLILSTKEKIYL